jgi:hypothetical protein
VPALTAHNACRPWMEFDVEFHPLDPLLPVVNDRFETTKIANFPTASIGAGARQRFHRLRNVPFWYSCRFLGLKECGPYQWSGRIASAESRVSGVVVALCCGRDVSER